MVAFRAVCKARYDAKGLRISLESGWQVRVPYEFVQLLFGYMPEWRVAQIMCQCSCLDDVGVYPGCQIRVVCNESLGQSARDLSNFQSVRQAIVEQLSFVAANDLGDLR